MSNEAHVLLKELNKKFSLIGFQEKHILLSKALVGY